jgi:ABC-2 type transport system ATP-binding protein
VSATVPVVVIKDLTKKYGEFVALDSLTMNVERGQILGFIGPNGAGKTTTIKILVGLARPTSGSATIAGADCATDPRRIKRLIGYMPDTFGTYDNMRVSEYLDFFGAAFGVPRRERVQRIGEALELAGASHFRDLFVETLSHGMKQRVAIARTLIHNPEVLILDEPTNGLDPQARIEMRELLLGLAARGKTLLVTSHVLPELARICNRVAIITRGRLRAFGSLAEVLRQLNPLQEMEVQLTRADAIDRVVECVRRHIESGTEVHSSAAECVVRFRTSRTEDQLARLLADLVALDAGVSQFREVQSDLEEAFLSLARADKNAPARQGARAGAAV